VEVVLRILDLGTRWRWLVSFTPRPLYPRGKRHWYPLDTRLGASQSRSGRGPYINNHDTHTHIHTHTQTQWQEAMMGRHKIIYTAAKWPYVISEDNIKIQLREKTWEQKVDWTALGSCQMTGFSLLQWYDSSSDKWLCSVKCQKRQEFLMFRIRPLLLKISEPGACASNSSSLHDSWHRSRKKTASLWLLTWLNVQKPMTTS